MIGIHRTVAAPYIRQIRHRWASTGVAVAAAAAVFAAGRRGYQCFAGGDPGHMGSAGQIRWVGAAEGTQSVEGRMPVVAVAAAAGSLFVDTTFHRAGPLAVGSVQ